MYETQFHEGGTTRIVGVTIQGPPPLGIIHIPWSPGLNVLYGANGAGKTSILRAIDHAFAGYGQFDTSARAFIHLKTEGWWADTYGDGLSDYFPGEPTPWIRNHLYNLNEVATLRDRASDEPRFQNGELAGLSENSTMGGLLSKALVLTASENLSSDVLTDLVRNPYITLAAVGKSSPLWILYASAPPLGEATSTDASVQIARGLSSWRDSIPESKRKEHNEGMRSSSAEIPSEFQGLKDALDRMEPDLADSLRDALLDYWWEEPDQLISRETPYPRYATSELASVARLPLPFILWRDFHRTPDWVPIPFVDLGLVELEDGGMHLIASDAVADIDEHTRQWIRREERGVDRWAASEIGEGVEPHAEEALAYANGFIDDVIPTMPLLTWSAPTIGELGRGRLIVWKGVDPSSGEEIPIGELSAAQGRWVRLAVAVGITRLHGADDESGLLIDEPELALHRRATRQIASSLAEYANRHKLPIFVASHSAEFLAESSANLYHVHRLVPGDGQTEVVPLERESLTEAAELLDLEPGELLQMVKSFVLVEGEHDIAVLEEIIGEELRDAGVELVPMRGSDNLDSLLESNLLFTYTAAQLVIVLDGIGDTAGLALAWDEARALARSGSVESAKRRMNDYRRSLGLRIKEQDQLINFAIRSLDTGFYDRIELYGFARRDIIEYLEPSTFGLDQTWDELSAEYRSYRDVNTRPLSYKQWLGTRKKALFNTETIRASASLRGVQDTDEFARLVDRLEPTRRTR